MFHVAVLQHYNLFNIKDKLGLVEFRPIGHSPVISPSGRSTLLPNSVPSTHLQRVHPNPSSRYNTDIKQDEPQCWPLENTTRAWLLAGWNSIHNHDVRYLSSLEMIVLGFLGEKNIYIGRWFPIISDICSSLKTAVEYSANCRGNTLCKSSTLHHNYMENTTKTE